MRQLQPLLVLAGRISQEDASRDSCNDHAAEIQYVESGVPQLLEIHKSVIIEVVPSRNEILC